MSTRTSIRLDCRLRVANNDAVIRKLCAAGLAVAIPLATLGTPPVHVHMGDGAARHVVHAHFSSHHASPTPTNRPGLYRAKGQGDTLFLQLFVAMAAHTFSAPFVVASPIELSRPSDMGANRHVEGGRGHDPPTLVSLPSRAPPALLS